MIVIVIRHALISQSRFKIMESMSVSGNGLCNARRFMKAISEISAKSNQYSGANIFSSAIQYDIYNIYRYWPTF